MSNSNPSEPATSSLRTFRNPPSHEFELLPELFEKKTVGDNTASNLIHTVIPSPLGCLKTPPLHFGSILTSTNPTTSISPTSTTLKKVSGFHIQGSSRVSKLRSLLIAFSKLSQASETEAGGIRHIKPNGNEVNLCSNEIANVNYTPNSP